MLRPDNFRAGLVIKYSNMIVNKDLVILHWKTIAKHINCTLLMSECYAYSFDDLKAGESRAPVAEWVCHSAGTHEIQPPGPAHWVTRLA